MFAHLRGTRASNHLDMVRGLAAVAVVLFHVRYRFFVDFADLPDAGMLAQVWYALTAYGHDAVMVFFVVSGFLVGSATIRDCRAGTWSWGSYLWARCVRLYVVLVPALLLTWAWDRLGLVWFGDEPIYTGVAPWYRHDYFDVAARSSIGALAGNAAFLQGIVTTTFGSNDALWSLAYEFWYYIAFPLMAATMFGTGNWILRIASCAGVFAVLSVASPSMAVYFPIWLLGMVVGLLSPARLITSQLRTWLWCASMLFVVGVTATHMPHVKAFAGGEMWPVDYSIGLGFAALLYIMLHDQRPPSTGGYAWTARKLANSSYTLYLIHLPMLVFLRGWLLDDPWTPSPGSLVMGSLIAAAALVYAFGVATLTEARTASVKEWLTRTTRLSPFKAASSKPAAEFTAARS